MYTIKDLLKNVAQEAFNSTASNALYKALEIPIILSCDAEGNRYGKFESMGIEKIDGKDVVVLYPEDRMNIELEKAE